MDISYGGNGSGEEIYNGQKGKKRCNMHSTKPIQRLEAYYKECLIPDAKQGQRLSSELGLDQKQIKFWFQNKRSQIEAQNEMSENNSLRAENEKNRLENLAMQEALKNITCPTCNGSFHGEDEKQNNLQQLRMENARLKKEHERAIILLNNVAPHRETFFPVINTIEGQRNLMKLSQGMVKEFGKALSMSNKLDFPHMSVFENSGLRVSVRKTSGPGQFDGIVVSAASTIWLPLSKENLFEFIKDVKNRNQWDVMSSGNPVSEIARVPTGTHRGNCISILQTYVTNETRLIMLQESSIDPLGAQLIYAPIDLGALAAFVNGEDNMKLPILPSGYIISGDGRAKNSVNRASSSSNASNSVGSLLTVAFQILGSQSTGQLNMESVATVRSLISTTIRNIRVALHLSD